MPDTTILYADETFVLANAGALMVSVWWDAPRPDQIHVVARKGRPVDEANDRRTGLAQFIVAGTPRFSSETRDAVTELYRAKIFRLGTAHIIEVGGLKGAATRAFLNTVTLLGRGADRVKVFSDPGEGAEWMAGRLNYTSESTGVIWGGDDVMKVRADAEAARQA